MSKPSEIAAVYFPSYHRDDGYDRWYGDGWNEWRLLEPGMVLTIEPGIYIPEDCTSVDEKWRGIGIRIEDDVLVTQHGYQVLSHAIPKTIAEIEAIMR